MILKARNRIVITGMGWVTPLGHDLKTVWDNTMAGKTAMDFITHFDASTFPTKFATEVKNYDFRKYVQHPEYHQHAGLNTAFALGAARQAWTMAGLDEKPPRDMDQVGIYLGSGEGSLDFPNYVAANIAGWDAERKVVDPNKWIRTAAVKLEKWREVEQEANMTLCHLAMELGARGPAYNCLTACAASTQAVGEAVEILRRGDAQVMISGGAHSMIHPFGVTGFNRLTALSNRNDSPCTASRPFDRTRDGFVLGEGSGMLVIETLEHAQARRATIQAEILGYGSSADAYRITDIQPEGRGAVAAMRYALKDAGVDLKDIHYISAHGTGTSENDSIESKAVKVVFGEHARQIPMSSIKSMTGHLIAAAGAVELIMCVMSILTGKIPPTMNLHDPDPACDLDYVPNAARDHVVETALSNSFGFGGQNDTLIVRRFRD